MEKCKQCYKYDPTGQTECNFCDFQEIYIERSKVDKAIKEIEELAKAVEKVTFSKKIRSEDVLEILKRNVGE